MNEKLVKAKGVLNKSFLLNAQSRKEALQKGENVMTIEDMIFLMSFEINLYPHRSFGPLFENKKSFDNQTLEAAIEEAKKENSLAEFHKTFFSKENKEFLLEKGYFRITFSKPSMSEIVFFSEKTYIEYLILQFQELLSGLGSALG